MVSIYDVYYLTLVDNIIKLYFNYFKNSNYNTIYIY